MSCSTTTAVPLGSSTPRRHATIEVVVGRVLIKALLITPAKITPAEIIPAKITLAKIIPVVLTADPVRELRA